MARSLAPVMYWAVRPTFGSTLRLDAEQLPYQALDATGQDTLCRMLSGAAVEL
jgi:hypothetical protein